MREIIKFEDYEVEIWRRPYQRRMYLTVREDGRVRVTCGRGISRGTVLGFVARNRQFVARHQPGPAPTLLSGDQLLYLGESRPLRLTWTWESRARVEISNAGIELLVPVGSGPAVREAALLGFFKAQGRTYLLDRAAHLARRTGLLPSAVTVRGPRSRWGSCTDRGAVSLNWKLIAAPPAVIDYVIIHELAHLRHLDHSPAFWALVAHLDFGHVASRRWLRAHQRDVHAQFTPRHSDAR